MHDQIHTVSVKVADVTAAGAVGTAAAVNLTSLNLYVQIGAGLVAIVAGLAAAAFHIYKMYRLHTNKDPIDDPKDRYSK